MMTTNEGVKLSLEEITENIRVIKKAINALPHSGYPRGDEFGLYTILRGTKEYYEMLLLEQNSIK